MKELLVLVLAGSACFTNTGGTEGSFEVISRLHPQLNKSDTKLVKNNDDIIESNDEDNSKLTITEESCLKGKTVCVYSG